MKQSLDGEWRVEMVQASDIDLEEEPFAAEDFDDSAFGRIDVPSHLQNAGYMNHKYVNIQYPWDGHENPQEPNVPETNHVALYRRTFTVAERLDTARQNGGTVSITFHGMATEMFVWVNGVFVGYGEDVYTPTEVDITEALHDGENVVAVACYEYSSASWLEDQDYWRLHGLFRSVELAAQPHVHIEDMKVEADWNPETATGSLDALLAVRNAKNAATVSATLKDLSGNVVWETALAASDETGIVSGSLDVKPWSAESPALYELQVVVIGHDGAIVETATQRVGFRRFPNLHVHLCFLLSVALETLALHLAHQHRQHGLLRVQTVFRLVKHHGLRAVHHLVGHFAAAVRGQAVHENRILLGQAHHLRVDLIGGKIPRALFGFRFHIPFCGNDLYLLLRTVDVCVTDGVLGGLPFFLAATARSKWLFLRYLQMITSSCRRLCGQISPHRSSEPANSIISWKYKNR